MIDATDMEFSMDYLWIFLLIFFVIVGLVFYFYEKKRSEELELVAKALGFSFSKSGRRSTKAAHESFELFSRGQSKELKNELWGKDKEKNISIFGYSYNHGDEDNMTTHSQTVLSIESSKLHFPKFELRPKSAFHKIGEIFGYQDINFDAFPAFSKTYLLRGEDEMKIRALFTPKLINYLESKQNIHLEAQGNTLIFYEASKRCKPDEIKAFYQAGQVLLSNFRL